MRSVSIRLLTSTPFKGFYSIFLSFCLMAGCAGDTTPDESTRPNIVLIMADDMGYSDIGSYGGEIRTPNLDRLADHGVAFTRFYNAARCCPTRAALLTGLYPHLAGMGGMVSAIDSDPESGPYQGFLNDRSVTIAEVLKGAGYQTYMSGKWHVGEKPEHWPRKRGFDRYFGLISGASSYFEIIKDQPRVRQMVLDDQPWEPPAEGFYMTDAITDHAVEMLQEHASGNSDTPFFLYVAYTAPHWPLHALPEDIARYEGRYDVGWDSVRAARYRRMLQSGIIDDRFKLSERPSSIPPWPEVENKEEWSRMMTVYAAMVDRMDQGIGRIVEQLEEMGAYDNTVILFLSDNGGCAEDIAGRNLNDPDVPIGERGSYVAYKEPWANVSNTPFRWYKQYAHEGGIATPFIAHWPEGITEPGRLSQDVGHVTDVMATVVELADATYPDSFNGHAITPLTGESLLPVLKGQPRKGHDVLFWEHIGNRAVRQENWKLVYNRRIETWELYDLEKDPTELNNLAEQMPDKARELRVLWENWADSVGVRQR